MQYFFSSCSCNLTMHRFSSLQKSLLWLLNWANLSVYTCAAPGSRRGGGKGPAGAAPAAAAKMPRRHLSQTHTSPRTIRPGNAD